MGFKVSREYFQMFAEKAVETLPEEYKKYFTNITIFVEDYPGKEENHGLKRGELLLGQFSGVPYPEKRSFFAVIYPLPDKITLFQRNIESICSSEQELMRQIQQTLIHEVGHYFGLSEKKLREYED